MTTTQSKLPKNIYQFVLSEEAQFTHPIDVHGWNWSMKDHIQTTFYYKHGRLLNGNDDDTPVKNIIRPLLNVQYRAEDIDVKDIVLYVDDPDSYHLSFLVKKYHDDVFLQQHNLDEFIDDFKESKVDYGLAIAKKGVGAKPIVVDLRSIAFCDQTDALKGPIAFKHFFNPAELKDMEEVGWGDEANGATTTVDELIQKATQTRQNDKQEGVENKTPTSYIEVYEVHGPMPESYLDDEGDPLKYKLQFQIIAYYRDEDDNKVGVTLFRKELKEPMLKKLERDKIYSRACGYGGAEELFEDQVWTNYSVIQQKNMLDAASKIVLKAIGSNIKARYPHGLKNVDNLDIIELNEGEDLAQIDNTPRSLQLFDNFEQRLREHAQETASAHDPILGKEAPSGTPFRAQERQVIEGRGIHEYRKGKYAKWLEEVYREWIIPYIVQEITKGTRFLAELTTEEMQYVADKLVENKAKKFVIEKLFAGEVVTEQDVQFFKEETRRTFMKNGNKVFLEILKDEFKRKPLRIKINISNKQKDLGLMTDKLVNIFRQIIANPQAFQQLMQMPEMAKTFNDILEYSGLTPVHYAGTPQALPAQPLQPELETSAQPNQ